MRALRSLRLRFLLAFALYGATLTLVLGAIAWRGVQIAEGLMIERWIAAEVEHAAARRAADPDALLPSSRFLLATTDPAALPDGLEERARSLPDGVHEPKGREQRWQLHIQTLPDGARLYGCVDENALEASEGHESTARTVRWVASTVVALLGIALGLFTTRRIIAPLRRMTDAVSTHDPAGPPPDLQSLVSDDELGVLAEQLEIAMARVAASARQEQLFGRYASHELRSSLAVASGVTELLEDLEDTRLQRPLARLRRATEDMEGIVETCLWLARSQGQVPSAEPVDLRALADDLLIPLRRRASPDVALELDIEPAATLDAPPLALRMIVNNLLTNAVRHTATGRIVLRADAEGVEVRDTGPGIPPDILARITEPFVRGPGEGHGLGLSIVNDLCTRLGWRLEVESIVGEGTIARVRVRDVGAAPAAN